MKMKFTNIKDTVEEYWDFADVCAAIRDSNPNSLKAFKEKMALYLNVGRDRLALFPSGRQALTSILKNIDVKNKTIMVSAFNCPVIKEAIHTAGWNMMAYDLESEVGYQNWDSFVNTVNNNIGAILITHYFGVPSDFGGLIDFCKKKGVVIIEDCAHSFGATINGKQAGTIGDASIFSFNYDKPISLGWGGMALINNQDIAIRHEESGFEIPDKPYEIRLLKKFMRAMKFRRLLISRHNNYLINLLYGLGFFPQFNNSKNISIGNIQAELGLICLDRYDEIMGIRNANAEKIISALNFPTWPRPDNVEAAWLKQRVRVEDASVREAICSKLQSMGLRVGNFNWPSILKGDINEGAIVASNLSRYWIDVPVHQNLSEKDLDCLISTINSSY